MEGKHTETDRLVAAVTKMWIVQFVNTAFIVLLVKAKLNTDITLIFHGKYSDFTNGWYRDVGFTIVLTTFVTAFFPLLNIGFLLEKTWKRWHDRGYTPEPRITRKLRQKDYEHLYTGPRFMIENRYSMLISMTFVIMCYSSAIPVLYFAGLIVCVI